MEFDNAKDAQEAAELVTGRKLNGMVLKVKMADVAKTPGGGEPATPVDRLAGLAELREARGEARARGQIVAVANDFLRLRWRHWLRQ